MNTVLIVVAASSLFVNSLAIGFFICEIFKRKKLSNAEAEYLQALSRHTDLLNKLKPKQFPGAIA